MKTSIKYATYLLFSVLACIGCNSSDENILEPVEGQVPETYTISLGMSNIEVDTRAADGTIYGINVYFDKEKDGNENDIYAYGLFDDQSKMSLTLLSGYTYKFVCSAVKDGKSKLYYGQYGGNAYSGYAAPFQTTASSSTMLNNAFITGATTYLSGLGDGMAVLKTGDSYSSFLRPSIERYYGEVTDYTPVKNGTVNIPLKKTYFGSKLIVNGDLDGTVTVTCKIGYDQLWSINTTEEYQGKETIYSYNDVDGCWLNENNISATITLSYDSNRGDYWDLSSSKTVTFKRNVLTTITVNVNPDYSSGAFQVAEEELDEENYIDFGINDEGELDITITPEEE